MRKLGLPALLACVLTGSALYGATGSEGAFLNASYFRPMPAHERYGVDLVELYRLYGDREWEIVPGFKHTDGLLRRFKAGDTLTLNLSVGPIGERTYARSKGFGRGNSPMPAIEILKDGKPDGEVVESILFCAGACCSGLLPYAVQLPSRIPPGLHRVRVTWEDGTRKLEALYRFEFENPEYGKPRVDPDVAALQAAFPNAKVVALRQGQAAPELNLEAYAGCADAFLANKGSTSRAESNYGGLDHLWVGTYGSEHRTLIRFDLSALPKGAKLEAARLKLHLYNDGDPRIIAAHRLLKAWRAGDGKPGELYGKRAVQHMDWQHGAREALEGECSWLCARKPEAWGQPGCGQSGVDFEAQALPAPVFDPKTAEGSNGGRPNRFWLAWDVSAAARAWLARPEENFGLLLRPGDRETPDCRFYASEFHDPILRPALIVAYRP